MLQVCELTGELGAVQTQRDSLLTAQVQCQQEAQQLRDSLQVSQSEILNIQADLSAAALREEELIRQCADVAQHCDAERCQLLATTEEMASKVSYNTHRSMPSKASGDCSYCVLIGDQMSPLFFPFSSRRASSTQRRCRRNWRRRSS